MSGTLTVIRSLLLVTLLLLAACQQSRRQDPDEPRMGEWFFVENGMYYRTNCADHAARERYTGIDTFFHDNSRVKAVYIIRDGVPDGHWEQFNADGSKRVDLYFEHGTLTWKVAAR